jgi:hypothetical protein
MYTYACLYVYMHTSDDDAPATKSRLKRYLHFNMNILTDMYIHMYLCIHVWVYEYMHIYMMTMMKFQLLRGG